MLKVVPVVSVVPVEDEHPGGLIFNSAGHIPLAMCDLF